MAAIWMALVLLFLIGATALAIDTSGFFNGARVDQTTADLACLAGARELPLRPDDALTIAAENVKTNFPEMAGATSTPIPRGVELVAGGNVVTINAPAEDNRFRMQISVTSSESRGFSKIWSSSDVLITQLARCTAVADTGPTMLPVGILTGTFDDDLLNCAGVGTCGALDSGDDPWSESFARGVGGEFEKHWGTWTAPDPDTGQVGIECPPLETNGYTDLCNAIWPDYSSPDLSGALGDRLSHAGSPWSEFQGLPPSHLTDVFGPSEPSWWEASLFGPYDENRDNQYYWDDTIVGCNSPRLAMLPIVEEYQDWEPGDPGGAWGTALKKIVGFYSIYIHGSAPDYVDEVIWFGPNTTCDGEKLDFYGNVGGSEHVKLIGA
jgi:Flp pilus assembly protein TadG